MTPTATKTVTATKTPTATVIATLTSTPTATTVPQPVGGYAELPSMLELLGPRIMLVVLAAVGVIGAVLLRRRMA